MGNSYYIVVINILIILLNTGCTNKTIDRQMSQAENVMMDRPDSALTIMISINPNELADNRQKAMYALLMTQAKDRNRINILQDDSLIRYAVEYFKGKRNDKKRLGRSYFYSGKIFHMRKDDESALRLYLEAKNTLEETDDYNYLSFVHQYIGRINDDKHIYDKALENYRKSIIYNNMCGESSRDIYSYRNIIWIYDEMGKTDSVELYLKKVNSLLKEDDTLSSVYPSIARLKGKYEARKGNYDYAISLINSAIRHESNDDSRDGYYQTLGIVYLQMGRLNDAEEIFSKIVKSNVKLYQSGAYYYLSKIEEERLNYKLSLRYKEISDSILHIQYDIDTQNKISDIQRKNEKNIAEMEKIILVQSKRIETYGWLLSIVCFIVFTAISYKTLKKQFINIYKRKVKKRINTEISLYLENEKKIEQYSMEIDILKEKEENYEHEIESLNNKLTILHNENAKFSSKFKTDATDILLQFKKGVLVDEHISQDEREKIFDLMNSLYEGLISDLKSKYSLNDRDIMFIILLKLGFSTTEIASVFEYEENTIYKKKQRLRSRLKQSGNEYLNDILK